MSNIQPYKKPQLIILEEQPKLRTIPMESRLAVAKKLVVNLLSDLGVGKNADTDHHIRTIKFISESMINYSEGEISKAFQMFIASEFREKPFQQLNSVIVGKVMNEYENYKREKLRVYRQKTSINKNKPPTEAEQERIMLNAVDRVKKEIKETKNIQGHAHHIYDFLVKSGRVEFSDAEKKASYNIAKRQLISEAKNKAIVDYDLHKIIDKTISEINKNGNSSVVAVAKKILLIDYLTKEK